MNHKPQFSLPVLVRNLIVELVVYAVMVVVYFLVVLKYLESPLKQLFVGNLPVYALASVGLIVIQGVMLDYFVSFLFKRLGLPRFE